MRHRSSMAIIHTQAISAGSTGEVSLAAVLRKSLLEAATAVGVGDEPSSLHTKPVTNPDGNSCLLYFDRAGLSEILGAIGLPIAGPTLASKANRGGGPPYTIVNGRAAYMVDDVVAWLAPQLSRPARSTSERRAALRPIK
jgi:hypothetical protein